MVLVKNNDVQNLVKQESNQKSGAHDLFAIYLQG